MPPGCCGDSQSPAGRIRDRDGDVPLELSFGSS